MVKIVCPNCNEEYELKTDQKPHTSYKCPECEYNGIMEDA